MKKIYFFLDDAEKFFQGSPLQNVTEKSPTRHQRFPIFGLENLQFI
jgi:hypothetical protein